MFEVTSDIGDNRRCSLTIWQPDRWQELIFTPIMAYTIRTQDHLRYGKVIGQTFYFPIAHLPTLTDWLDTTGRAYRLKSFDELVPPSAETVKNRNLRQQQLAKADEIRSRRNLKL